MQERLPCPQGHGTQFQLLSNYVQQHSESSVHDGFIWLFAVRHYLNQCWLISTWVKSESKNNNFHTRKNLKMPSVNWQSFYFSSGLVLISSVYLQHESVWWQLLRGLLCVRQPNQQQLQQHQTWRWGYVSPWWQRQFTGVQPWLSAHNVPGGRKLGQQCKTLQWVCARKT